DFDGTVTEADVGDEICHRFADPRWRDIDRLWEEKRISLPEAQKGMWGLIEASPEDVLAHAHDVGRLRPGLDTLLDACAGAEVVLASGGFDFYIRAILGDRLSRFAAVFSNRGVFAGRKVEVSFPLRDTHGCALCAVCKGRICAERKNAGRRVVFIGDGTSDRCTIGV